MKRTERRRRERREEGDRRGRGQEERRNEEISDLCAVFRGPWGIRKHRHPGSQLLRVLTIYSCDPLLYPCGGLCQAWVGVYKLGDRPQWAVTSDSGTEAYWVELRMGTLLHNTASTRLHQPSRVPAVGIYPFTVPLRLHLTTQKGPRLVSARAILKAIRTQPNGKMDECHQPL